MTTHRPLFYGSITALITPMNNHGEVDFNALKKLVEYHTLSQELTLSFLSVQPENQLP